MNKIFDPATDFAFKPASFVPFKDREICERFENTDITMRKNGVPNPVYQITVHVHYFICAS